MVDCVRRKPNILLCTYADVLCPRPHCCDGRWPQRHGAGQPPSQRPSQHDQQRHDQQDQQDQRTEEEDLRLSKYSKVAAEEPDGDRFGLSVNLRGGGVWVEPLHDLSAEERPRRREASPQRRSVRPESTWDVTVPRGSRGLGLSVEPAAGAPGQVAVKRVFPHQPAALTGRVRPGDWLVGVNDLPVRGLSVQEVLHVLRVAGEAVTLTLARPGQPDRLSDSEREPESDSDSEAASRASLRLEPDCVGTFSVTLQKVNNTLGLSLRRTDDTVLGHTIRAKVREPALSDTRLRVGDKLIQVNGVDVTAMAHAEVVALLRQCSDSITLTLYRDGQATPGSPGSPVSSRSTRLRPEAVEMLTGLAFRREHSLPPADCRRAPSDVSGRDVTGRPGSRAEQVRRLSCGSRGSPRLRRKRLTPSPDVTAFAEDPFSRLSGIHDMDEAAAERLDALTRISESSALPDQAQLTSERRDQLTSVSDLLTGAAALDSDGWPESGEESDAELQERHLRRVTAEGEDRSSGSARQRHMYRSVQPRQRTKPGEALKKSGSEERLDAGSPEVGGDLGKWKGFTLDTVADQDLDSGVVSGGETAARGQSMCIQLRRGWSARLGFSLHATDGSHVVSQIHPDSVAERDGRLRVGDALVKVNDVEVNGLTSEAVIDLLRKTKGAISLAIVRH